MKIEDKILEIQGLLNTVDERTIVRKHILSEGNFILSDEQYFTLKEKISDHFNIHPNQIQIVGSGKLGFSMSQDLKNGKKRWRHFGDESDLDIAIISNRLFDEIWNLLIDFVDNKGYWRKQQLFTQYHFQGWMRPDMLPNSPKFEFTQTQWWDFFNTLSNSQEFGPYKINAGLYRTWNFLEKYQIRTITDCKMSIL